MSISPELAALKRAAERLAASAPVRNGRRLPPLLILTDPRRTPDPVAVAERLPRGSGLVYRAFGATDALDVGRSLAAVSRRRGLVFLVGADPVLASACGADGVHLPERLVASAPRLRARRPLWRLTGAAHGAAALHRAAAAGLDAALLSAVFPSGSPSAGRPLGPTRFSALSRLAELPVYALGGIDAASAPRLRGAASGAAAVAAALR
jgi:thiamine-phosphate pyrophosphorylase